MTYGVPLPKPENVRLLPCSKCGIKTNHHKTTTTNEWYCWCGNEYKPEPSYHPVSMDPKVQS
jgi:hypothetical protein